VEPFDPVIVDGEMANTVTSGTDQRLDTGGRAISGASQLRYTLILVIAGAAIFLGSIFAPPSLMDDVDAVNAQIARNMLDSGDWVTPRIDGVVYLEKSPLNYWLMAASYFFFGVHDWAARLPAALGAVGLMLVTAALGTWGLGRRGGFYAGLAVGTCVGLYLFTRIVIPDVLLTLAVTCALYCFLRAVEGPPGKEGLCPTYSGRLWAYGFWASIGAGMLLKGLLGALVPAATGGLYLLFRRRFGDRDTWRRLRPVSGICVSLAIFGPWVALAALRNPPIFDFTLHSDPGVYRGFLWFYFINEHILRFLNLRYPHDYNTVPRVPFLLLTFLSFSTTQEYYSLPCYPAFAILAGAALLSGPKRWISAGYAVLAAVGVLAGATAAVILYLVRGVQPTGDISSALTQNPNAYTLSLGHMLDLTLTSFAYLRAPLALAGAALAAGSVAAWLTRRRIFGPLCLAAMMVLFVRAAYLAMGVFDPYLSSQPLAKALQKRPPGRLVIEGHYYPASSVVFYTNQAALLLHGRQDNLIYGSAAPGAPPVFLEDADLVRLWRQNQRLYLVAPASSEGRYKALLGPVYVVAERGGKCLLSNMPAGGA
jgi:4-amino-4-deoxy-L-arabinose transferase-like glycosyltransferase